MAPGRDDLEDFDDEILADDEKSEDSSDDYSFDDEDGDDEERGSKSAKDKSESSFDRDSYYLYKDKLIQLSGTISPKARSAAGVVTELQFKSANDQKVYTVVMDAMGEKLKSFLYQELLVTGVIAKVSEKESTITIKTYL